jgi:hypothetical protein
MRDETYYTVLNVKETASSAEIKTAYRDLIKQVHPDTKAHLAPYLRKIAEDKTKELIEAYTVLSNFSKRRDYDRQLAEYRRQTMPQAPLQPTPRPPTQQATSQSSSGPFCKRCGTLLYRSGLCGKCNKFAVPIPTPPQPKVVRRLRYNWAQLLWIPLWFLYIVARVTVSKSDMDAKLIVDAVMLIFSVASFAISWLIERRNSRARIP